MGLLNFDLKMPDLSNLSSIKETVMSKLDSLGIADIGEKVGGVITGNSLISGLSDSVMGSIKDEMPSLDMDGLMDFDMESMMGGFSTDSMSSDIDEMINGIDINLNE